MKPSNTVLIRIISLVVALLWIVLLSYSLPVDSTDQGVGFSWHAFLIATEDPMYPANIQVMMWLSFFFCIGELLSKWFNLREERWRVDHFDLYSNPDRVTLEDDGGARPIVLERNEALIPEILAAIYYAKRNDIMPDSLIGDLFRTINFQFQSTNNVGDVYSAVTAAVDLKLHLAELSYTVVRYIAWLIPTLGFIGTVIGIALALGTAGSLGGDDPDLLVKVIPLLAIAFYTTLLALLLSAAVMILLQVIQAQDEENVNRVGKFCLEHIVTNLKPR